MREFALCHVDDLCRNFQIVMRVGISQCTVHFCSKDCWYYRSINLKSFSCVSSNQKYCIQKQSESWTTLQFDLLPSVYVPHFYIGTKTGEKCKIRYTVIQYLDVVERLRHLNRCYRFSICYALSSRLDGVKVCALIYSESHIQHHRKPTTENRRQKIQQCDLINANHCGYFWYTTQLHFFQLNSIFSSLLICPSNFIKVK